MKVSVHGLGYVGTVTAAGLVACGHDVIGVDIEPTRVARVGRGESPVVEAGVAELLEQGVHEGRLRATTNVERALDGADLSLLCVGTPSTGSGATNLAHLLRAATDIRAAMDWVQPPASGHHSVVVRSTVPPGTVRRQVAPIFEEPPEGWRVGTAMCPEFLREGSGLKDFYDPPFVVVGTADPTTAETVASLFSFAPTGVQTVSVETAEAVKYACNAFHATKVTFANEMARVFAWSGVDSREVMELFCQDHKLNISPRYLRPGFAFGGSCLPKDLRALQHLARSNDVDVPLLDGVVHSNDLVVKDVLDRVLAGDGRCVALLGLSFKAGTDDLRESPYVELAERLIGKGFDVRVYDPIINPSALVGANLRQMESRLPHLSCILKPTAAEALAGAHVALVGDVGPDVVTALLDTPPRRVIDLHGGCGEAVEALSGFEGLGW